MYLCSSKHVTRCCISYLSTLIDILYLWHALYICFIFVKPYFLLLFKFMRIFLGYSKLFVGSATTFLFSSLKLPARRCPSNLGSILIMVVNSIKNNQPLFICFPIYITTQPKQTPIFLDLVPSIFNFFFGVFYSPLILQANNNIDFLKI